jgi:hypothetical protein
MPVIADPVLPTCVGESREPTLQPKPGPFRARRLRLLLLLLMAALLTWDAEAARKRRRTARPRSRPVPHHRAPATRPAPAPAAAEPKAKLEAFRDLAVGAEFYHPADQDRKLYPLKKVSATQARHLAGPGDAPADLVAIPGELKVIVKQPGVVKAATKKKSRRR